MNYKEKQTMHYKAYLASLGFATIFGFSFMFTREGLNHIDPFHLLGLRFGLAALTLTLLRQARMLHFHIGLKDTKALLPLALFLPLIYFPSETVGIQLTSSSHAGMVVSVIPIFVTILSAFLLREYPTRLQLPFIFATVSGVIFIFFMQSRGEVGTQLLGNLALMGAVLAAASYNIASRHAAEKYSPLQRTWAMMVTGAIAFNAVSLGQHIATGGITGYLQPLLQVWPSIVYLGVLSSVVAFFLINYSLSHITAIQSAVFANLVTVISIAAGVLILGEDFYWYQAVGAITILAGVYGTNRFAPHPHEVEPGKEKFCNLKSSESQVK